MAEYSVGDKVRITYEIVIQRVGHGGRIYSEANRSFQLDNEAGRDWTKKVELIERAPLKVGDNITHAPFIYVFKILFIDDKGAYVERSGDGWRYSLSSESLKKYNKVSA